MFGDRIGTAATASSKQSLAQLLAQGVHTCSVAREALAVPIEVTFQQTHEARVSLEPLA